MILYCRREEKKNELIYLLEDTEQGAGRDSTSFSMILKKGGSVLLNHNKTLPVISLSVNSHGASSSCFMTAD